MPQLISELSIGAKVTFGKYQVNTETAEPIIWSIADKNHAGYPANSVTLITNQVIDFRAFDGKETGNPDANAASNGNNRYLYSNIRQWLNKSGNSWWDAQYAYDKDPSDANTGNYGTGYSNTIRPGFLMNFAINEQNLLLPTTLTVVKNTSDGAGSETVIDKIFLPSTTEVGLANENSIAEGSKFPIFTDNTSRIIKPTAQAVKNSKLPTRGDYAWYWWLRTPKYTVSHIENCVGTNGAIYTTAYSFDGSKAIRPVCNIKNDSFVIYNETTGMYDVTPNLGPRINVDTLDLGIKDEAFAFNYIVTDYENNPVTIEISIDTYPLIEITPSLNVTNTFEIASDKFAELSNGEHVLEFMAYDQESRNNTIIEFNFTKIEKIITQHIDAISSPLSKRNDDGTYTLILPVTTVDEVYTDIAKNETLTDSLNGVLRSPSAIWGNTTVKGKSISSLYSKGSFVFSSNGDDGVNIFDTYTGAKKFNITSGFKTTRVVSSIGNTNIYFSGGNNVFKYLFEGAIPIFKWTFTGHTQIINDITIDTNENIYTASDDTDIRCLAIDGVHTWTFTGHIGRVKAIVTDNAFVYSAGDDSLLKKISLDGTELKSVNIGFTAQKIIEKDQYLYILSDQYTITKRKKSDLSEELTIITPNIRSYISDIDIGPNNQIVIGTISGYVLIYDIYGKFIYEFSIGTSVSSIEYDIHNHIIVGLNNGEIFKYSLNRFDGYVKTTTIRNHIVQSSEWSSVNIDPVGALFKCSIVSKVIKPTSTVNVNITDLLSLTTANAASVKSIVEEHDGVAYIYSNTIPTGPIAVDISITNY